MPLWRQFEGRASFVLQIGSAGWHFLAAVNAAPINVGIELLLHCWSFGETAGEFYHGVA